MKQKSVLFMATGLMLLAVASTPANAYTSCVGGEEVTSNVYGTEGTPSTCTAEKCPSPAKTFCKSKVLMNWWTAFNWCRSNGGSLASFSAMCPGIPTVSNDITGACPALQGKGGNNYVWSSMGYGSYGALAINLSSGAVGNHLRINSISAFCE